MTDNEKAASVIWKPEDGCRCSGCTGIGWNPHAADYIEPPDMTRPEYYMPALESVEQWATVTLRRIHHSGWEVCISVPSREFEAFDKDCGKAAVAALAAYKDSHAGP